MSSVRMGATVLAVSFVLGACGPLSPSVSKFSGSKSASKTLGPGIFTTNTTDDKVVNHAEGSPTVLSTSSLTSKTPTLLSDSHGQVLDGSQVATFKTSGTVSIAQADASVTGTFTDHVPKIYISTDGLTMWERSELQGSIRISVDAGSLGKNRTIKVSIVSPSQASDANTLTSFATDSQTLRDAITGIVLTFDDSTISTTSSIVTQSAE